MTTINKPIPMGYLIIPKHRWRPYDHDKYLVLRYPLCIEFCFTTETVGGKKVRQFDVVSLHEIFDESRCMTKNYIGVMHYYEST